MVLEVHAPYPMLLAEALPAHIDSHDDRQMMMPIKYSCLCSNYMANLQMPFMQRRDEE